MNAEDEARLVEQARLESKQEEQAHLKEKEEARLVKDSIQEAK